MKKEIYMGHGLYKCIEVEQEKADTESDLLLTGQTVSEQMQDELEPIIHPTQHDESDDLEALKNEEMTEFEKSEYKRKIAGETKGRSVWGEGEADYTDSYWKREFYNVDSTKEEVEWKIVELEGGGFIRRPFPVKKATLTGPDRPETDSSRLIKKVEKYYFGKGEKWEHKYDT